MRVSQARETGKRIQTAIHDGNLDQAYQILQPILAQRTPFRLLDLIAKPIGSEPLPHLSSFLKCIASNRTEGVWVVIASALGQQLDRDIASAFSLSRQFIISADVWYAADIFGERLPGPALIANFQDALDQLVAWREDPNRWVRRTVGVAVHFWTKRSGGKPDKLDQARALLAFLGPMFEEWNMDALKGIGWGLKTMGRYYPDLLTDWLHSQILLHRRPHRTLILRKALTYLSDDQRLRAIGRRLNEIGV